MKKTVILIGVALLIVIAVLTNPKKEQHNKQLINKTFELIEDSTIPKQLVSVFIKEKTDYKNFVLFSLSGSKHRNYTLGLFGNIVVFNKDYLKRTFTNPNQKEVKKADKKSNWEQHFEITSIRTGYGASRVWKPAVLINIKNITSNDIMEYIDIKAVFIDTKSNTDKGTAKKYISTKDKPFLSGTNKAILLFTDNGYRGSPKGLKLRAKIFIENEFVKEVTIDDVELY